jgi:hypothetical protein
MRTLLMPAQCPACFALMSEQQVQSINLVDGIDDHGRLVELGRFAQYACSTSLSANRPSEDGDISRTVQRSCTPPLLDEWASE